MGRWQEATASYERACASHPENVRARLALCMGQLPVIYETEAQIDERRQAYEQQLQHLCAQAEQDRGDFAEVVGLYLPFFLAYQGRSDRDLQQQFRWARVSNHGGPASCAFRSHRRRRRPSGCGSES